MKTRYRRELPIWLRMLGAWRINTDSIDFNWGYFSPRFGLELLIHRGFYYDNQYRLSFNLGWGYFHIKLPFRIKNYQPSCEWDQYGLQLFEDIFWLRTGSTRTTCYLPFKHLIFEGHWIAAKDSCWHKVEKGEDSWEVREKIGHTEVYDYTYTCKNGDVQKRKATCSLEKRKWHRKWFPFLTTERFSIYVQFDSEVGEGSGSWKGGTVGCGYEKLTHESIEQCLRRMERERVFK